MKKNFTLRAFFVAAMIMSAAFVNNVSAQTETWASDKITIAYAPGGVSTTVVINEAYGGSESANNAFNADFIELYNLSAVPVNISDWSVQYYTAGQINAGGPTHTAHIPAATTLAGNSFYVIRISPIRASGAPLPCENLNASATFAETGIAPDAGKLVLSSTGADLDSCTSTSPNVVDRVGYGITPTICNETSNAGAPSATTSVQRRAGAPDTDDNSADFTASSAPTPCVALLGPTPTPTPTATPTPTPTPTPTSTPTPTQTPTPTPTPTQTPCTLTEGFNDITTLVPGGWSRQNHSQPIGTSEWFQGNATVFPSQTGAPTAYIATNFNAGAGVATLSNWLLTPPLTLQNNARLTFWTRTTTPGAQVFPDRLQVRMSTNGASTNVGVTATDVGDFTALLLDINPTYTSTGYPSVWTQFTITITGIVLPTTGRLAFRYFVENGGPGGTRSDYIGIDTVQFSCQTTAAAVSVSGRVMTADGRGIRNATMVLTGNSLPEPLRVTTGSFGYYMFEDLQVGETYVLTVNSTRYTFQVPSRVITLIDNVTDADFTADPLE